MNESHAISLFEKKVGAQPERSASIQLAAALEFMPLAIVQAAAFIKQRAPRESVPQYLQRFQKSDKQKINLLDYEGGQLRRDPEAKNAILVTWQISFEDIQERRPSAAGLLSLMSFFDRQGIPNSLLQEVQATKGKNKESDSSDREDEISVSSDADKFENDILLLRDYSLISVTSDPANFEMHRLVQLGMQKWLQAQDRLEHWNEVFIPRLDRHFPEGRFENWKECQMLFPHVQCATLQKPVGKGSMEKWASLLHKSALFAWERGNFNDSRKMGMKAMKTRESLFGARNERTLRSSNMLGLAYSLGREWKKAEDLQLQVMETRKEVLGPEHPDTLTSMANLASTYWNQGRWKEAEELEVQVMETFKEVLGPEHLSTLTSMANLASTYWNQGRWKEAEDLQLQVMETCKEVLGPEHPGTLTGLNNLALTLRSLGENETALQMMTTCAEYRSQKLGPHHPSTLSSMTTCKEWQSSDKLWPRLNQLHAGDLEAERLEDVNGVHDTTDNPRREFKMSDDSVGQGTRGKSPEPKTSVGASPETTATAGNRNSSESNSDTQESNNDDLETTATAGNRNNSESNSDTQESNNDDLETTATAGNRNNSESNSDTQESNNDNLETTATAGNSNSSGSKSDTRESSNDHKRKPPTHGDRSKIDAASQNDRQKKRREGETADTASHNNRPPKKRKGREPAIDLDSTLVKEWLQNPISFFSSELTLHEKPFGSTCQYLQSLGSSSELDRVRKRIVKALFHRLRKRLGTNRLTQSVVKDLAKIASNSTHFKISFETMKNWLDEGKRLDSLCWAIAGNKKEGSQPQNYFYLGSLFFLRKCTDTE
ncbi:P-loop containing nucleoside triphosphate hydrolase protein [Penicillium angulare]|uniref:P-loop containing nucleoside triphosphate hydrolase protein n=1 Tax=Penicillium angulare TaxID=116970 RepID=UPI002541830F|nr:P-loop containing nucleoside triphosphate hydrolase protein [Penicillium angulare]KAJ5291478.1 P-loop containing nucleoside triphosphate hydrolase protein [Penicillium angulare]